MSSWSWVIVCAPDVFSWNFVFLIVNFIQTILVLYRLRPVKFAQELEDVYQACVHLFKCIYVRKREFLFVFVLVGGGGCACALNLMSSACARSVNIWISSACLPGLCLRVWMRLLLRQFVCMCFFQAEFFTFIWF